MAPSASAASAAGGVSAQIAALQRMGNEELRKEWDALMDVPPSGSVAGLRRRLIHRVQELAYGGLSQAVESAIERMIERDVGEPGKAAGKPTPVGTCFIREWGGRRHEVTAIDAGFEYAGKRYRSLTAVAKVITGQHTNGQIFFGLKKRERSGK